MESIHPIIVLATVLANLPVKAVAQLGQGLVTVAGRDVATTLVGALVAAINSADDADDTCDCGCGGVWESTPALDGLSLMVHFNPRSERIRAIKTVRLLTDWGLRESKNWVDAAVAASEPEASMVRAVLFHDLSHEMAYAIQDHYVMHTERVFPGSWAAVTNQPAVEAQHNRTVHLSATDLSGRFDYGWGVYLYVETQNNNKIPMIKAYREAFEKPIGLKAAKYVMDQAFEEGRDEDCAAVFLNTDDSLVKALARTRKIDNRRVSVSVRHEGGVGSAVNLSTYADHAGVNPLDAGLEYR